MYVCASMHVCFAGERMRRQPSSFSGLETSGHAYLRKRGTTLVQSRSKGLLQELTLFLASGEILYCTKSWDRQLATGDTNGAVLRPIADYGGVDTGMLPFQLAALLPQPSCLL